MKNKYYLYLIFTTGIISAYYHAYQLMHNWPWILLYSDIVVFVEKLFAPGFPYVNKIIEYPVISGVFMQFMANLSNDYFGYYIFTCIFLVLAAFISTKFLYKIAENKKMENFLIYWIFAPSMFVFLIYNWDIIAVMFFIIALYFMNKNKNLWASFFLALGFCAKFYPAIYLIPLIIKNRKFFWGIIKILTVFIFTALLVNLPFMLKNFDVWKFFYIFNNLRWPNCDSIWWVIKAALPWLAVTHINIISLILFVISSVIIIYKYRKQSYIVLCCIITLLFLLTNKIFSPQYILWILPFFVLIPEIGKKLFYSLELTNLAVLSSVFLLTYFEPFNQFYAYQNYFFVILRHVILIVILIKLLKIKRPDALPQLS